MHIPSGMGRPGHLVIKDPTTLYSVGALPKFEFECNVSNVNGSVFRRVGYYFYAFTTGIIFDEVDLHFLTREKVHVITLVDFEEESTIDCSLYKSSQSLLV